MIELKLNVDKRAVGVKTPSKKAERNGKIVGIVYNKKENTPILIDAHDFNKLYAHLKSNSVISLTIDKKEERKVVLKETDQFLKTNELRHVDFYTLVPKEEIKILIPVELKGRPIGISKGGLIRKFTDNLLVKCTMENIPEKIEVDIANLDIGDFLHLKDLPASNVSFLDSSDKAIVAITSSSKSRSASKDEETPDVAESTEEEKAS